MQALPIGSARILEVAAGREAWVSTLGLVTSDWVLLAAVIVGGLLVTWGAMRLVLRETAKFSRNFPRTDPTEGNESSSIVEPTHAPGEPGADVQGGEESRRP